MPSKDGGLASRIEHNKQGRPPSSDRVVIFGSSTSGEPSFINVNNYNDIALQVTKDAVRYETLVCRFNMDVFLGRAMGAQPRD